MNQTIFLAVNYFSEYKKKVVNSIVENLNSSNLIELKYDIKKLIYESYEDIIDSLTKNINNSNLIIFIDIPDITLSQIAEIKSKAKIFQVFSDIPEHYHSFYKYSQFLYDGLLIEEPEYRNFFEVFGLPTFDGSLFANESAKLLGKNSKYESLIPLSKRLYSFSFIGRLDRPRRKDLLNNLKKYFNNIYIHDSSKENLSDKDLSEIIKNTKYLFNLTSIQPLNTFGFNKFPERLQLQRKSRALEYAMNGCIIFSEILPQKVFKTFSNDIIPIVEVPRSENIGKFCLSFLSKNDINALSKTIHEKTYQTYTTKNINLFFLELINEMKFKSSKFSKHKLNKKEIEKINYHYYQWQLFQKSRKLINSNIPTLSKLIELNKFMKYCFLEKREISFFETLKIFFKMFIFFQYKIFKSILNKILNSKYLFPS